MNIVRIRRTTVAFVAALSLAAVAVLPAASQATQRSVTPKAGTALTVSKTCSDLQGDHDRYTASASESRKAGYPEIAAAFDEGAANVKATAKSKECGWAA